MGRDGKDRRTSLATAGAVVAAVLSSACCWLPLLLLAAGVSGGAVAARIARWRPLLLPAGLTLLALAWWWHWRARSTGTSVAAMDCCAAVPTPRRRWTTGMLVLATLLVLGFGFFPDYAAGLLGNDTTITARAPGERRITLRVAGMTCAACATHLSARLRDVPGVRHAEAGAGRGTATVAVTETIPVAGLQRAVTAAGYRLTGIDSTAIAGR